MFGTGDNTIVAHRAESYDAGAASTVTCTVYGVPNAYTLEVQFAANESTVKYIYEDQTIPYSA